MLDERLAPVFEALIEHDLCFDALVKPEHLPFLLKLLRRYPALKTVIDHGAKPRIARSEWSHGPKTWRKSQPAPRRTASFPA